MKEQLLGNPQEIINYLKEWLSRHNEETKMVPIVQDLVNRTEWEFQTLSEMPEDAVEFFSPEFVKEYADSTDFIKESLPLPPMFQITVGSSAASISSASSSKIYNVVTRAGEVDDDSLGKWSSKCTLQYRELQEKQKRIEKVKQKLNNLNPDRIKELEQAYQEYSEAKSNEDKRISAGIAMRNVLEHFKGDLYELARNHHGENMTWERMAEILSIGGVGSIEHKALKNQEEEWRSLERRLSGVAKGQKLGLIADLDDIWTRLLDHLYIVLGLTGF